MAPSGIVLLAKPAGITSFTSLFAVKRALATKKVGHTGTLDSFADGLLVALSGPMTHLVNHITAFTKTYEAVIAFGAETDTLDPTGAVVQTAPLPTRAALEAAIARWIGGIMQEPPLYSALHVAGSRASDLARAGEYVELPARPVVVHQCRLLAVETDSAPGGAAPAPSARSAFTPNQTSGLHPECRLQNDSASPVGFAHITCTVSKGTYIRSLARDIARTAGSAAHLVALRRTRVGNFRLEDAAGFGRLGGFSIETALRQKERLQDPAFEGAVKEGLFTDDALSEIRSHVFPLTEEVARSCGLGALRLAETRRADFLNGKPLKKNFFSAAGAGTSPGAGTAPAAPTNRFQYGEYAVFAEDGGAFCGMVQCGERGFKYSFVVNGEGA